MEIAIAIVALGAIFFFMFRKQISDLFPRIKSINKGGVVLGSNQKKFSVERDPREEAELLIRQLDNELVRETEDLIKTELGNKKLLGAEAVPVLIKYFAVVYIEYGFLNVYRIIWGNQINLLDYLKKFQGKVPGTHDVTQIKVTRHKVTRK